jgi:hypothetical protein
MIVAPRCDAYEQRKVGYIFALQNPRSQDPRSGESRIEISVVARQLRICARY